MERSSGFYYGWYLVAGVFFILMISSGLGFYNHSLYMQSLANERGIALAVSSGAVSTFFIVGGVSGLVVGELIDRWDPRWIIVSGALIGGAALASMGLVKETWQLYAVFALFGVGNAGASLIPATTLVARWFQHSRSMALSVASTGLSVGGVAVTPLCAWWLTDVGLTVATPWLGLAYALLIIPVAVLVIRPWPRADQIEPGASAELDSDGATGAEVARQSGTRYRVAIVGRFFVLCTGAYLLVMGAQVGGIAHQFTLATERVDAAVAATVVSVLASASIVGRLVGGWLVSRISIRAFTAGNMLGQALALAWLAFAHENWELIVGALCFGATVGNLLMLQPLLLAESYGLVDYGRIFATSQAVTTVGVAGGPLAMGLLHDFAGGYQTTFLVAAGASVVALSLFAVAGPLPAPDAKASSST